MAPLPLFYSDIAVLDRNTHRDMRIAPAPQPFAFAAASHVLPAQTVEFALGCRDMPILFIQEEAGISPIFMIGMRSGASDFIDPEGRWTGLHAPAYLRRYPFIGGEVSSEQHVICVDGGFPGLQDKEGERLFTEEGEPADALMRVVAFVRDYGEAATATATFCAALKALDLFQPVTIDIRAPNGTSSNFTGFMAVSEERLNALPDEALLELKQKGYLGAIYAHLISLSNFGALGERAARRGAAQG